MGGQLRTYKADNSRIYSALINRYGILRTRTNTATADLWSANNFNDLARITAAAIVGQYPHSTHILGNSVLYGPTPPVSQNAGVAAIFEFRGRRGRAVTPGAGRRGSLIRTIRPVCQATKADGAVGGLVLKLIPPSRKNTWGQLLFRDPLDAVDASMYADF